MKKITFMLALLTASTTGAFAGTFTTSDGATSHVYAIKNVGGANGNYVCIKNAGLNATTKADNIAYFKVEAGSADGQYYLYCVSNSKYVSYSDTGKGAGKVTFAEDRTSAKQWKIVAESNATDKFDIIPAEIASPDNGSSSWNWFGGVGNQLGFYDANDGNSSWTFDAVVENATVSIKFNSTEVDSKSYKYLAVGLVKTAMPVLNYTTIASMVPETVVEETTAYTVNLAENLPFVKSENFDNAKWYLMDMHSNDTGNDDVNSGRKHYMWTYVAADQDVTLPQMVMNDETKITDNMQWCFVGDVVNGFKIYNKAAGSTLTLRKAATGNTAAVMSTTDDHNQFKLYPTTEGIANGFCFKLDGDDYYVNTQQTDPKDWNTKVLRGWNKADGGSTCRVFAPNKFVADAARLYNNLYVKVSELPAGAIGANSYLEDGNNLETLKSQYATATAEGYTTEQVNALAETMMKVNAAANATTVEAGKYYRLYNAQDKKFLCVRATNNAQMTTDASMGKAVSSVVTFADAETGRFRMMVEGKTFGKRIQDNKAITLEEDNSGAKGSYAVAHTGTTFTFYDNASNNAHSYLHCNNVGGAGNVVGWEALGEISPSYWHVIEATDVEIDMTAQGDKKYASAYLPFGVSNVAGATAYTGALNAEKNAIDMTATTAVPANTGFVLVGTADKATLTIGEAAAIEGNALTGTNTGIAFAEATPKANYLVFGVNADKVGFYTPGNVTAIPANKAYINASALSASAIALNFGNTVTGINAATINNGENNAPIYDLSGRRVWAPVKGGLYIQNGKKLVK